MATAARLCELTIAEAARRLGDGSVTSVELTESVLDRIDESNSTLNAYVRVMREQALEAAEAADASQPQSPLHGIPISIKDLIDIEGVPTEAGTRARRGRMATEDAVVTRRLRSAGAVIAGKEHTHEIAFGPVTPQTRNAWNVDRIAGGSSGGSAVAVAADATLASIATDTGCSVRLPACLNGVAGLKPTVGRVPRRGIVPLAWTIDQAGPIAKTVEDCALVLNAIAGPSPDDPSGHPAAAPDFTDDLERGVRGLRIGVPRNWFFDGCHPAVETAVREAIDLLASEGAEPVEVEIPMIEHALAAVYVLALVDAATFHARELRAMPDRFGDGVRLLLETGSLVPGTLWLDAQRVRALVRRSLKEVWEANGLDVLACPAAPIPAPASGVDALTVAGDREQPVLLALARNFAPINATGQPALSLPCGFADSMPAGLQIVGRPFDEATVLRVGHAYESMTEWHLATPPI